MADEREQLALPQDDETLSNQDGTSVETEQGGNTVKTAWPAVVGLTAEVAEKKIKEDMPAATVQVIPPGHFVTMDFNTGRVRLYIDSSGLVARTPTVG